MSPRVLVLLVAVMLAAAAAAVTAVAVLPAMFEAICPQFPFSFFSSTTSSSTSTYCCHSGRVRVG